MDIYVGIDPGDKGAVCALIPELGKAEFFANTEKPKDIHNFLESLSNHGKVKVVMVEKVHAIQGTSAGSNFKFGMNYSKVLTVSEMSSYSVDLVTPKKWQKEVGVPSTAKGPNIKKAVGECCDRLYSNVNIRGPRGGLLDGKSDALMIAHYAYLTYGKN